jgi:hypothetical protein
MGAIAYTDGNVRTFAVETSGQLDNKQDYLVELGTADDSVKLLATVGKEIGAVRNLPQPGSPQVSVRLLGKGGTLRLVQSAAISKGALVKAVVGGTVVTANTSGDRAIGRKISSGSGSAGEIIEVLDCIEKV